MALAAQGSVVFFSTSTALSTAISIAQVVGYSGPTGSAGVIDVTHLGSSAKEKLMGLRDEGQITIDVNLVTTDSGQTKMRECRANRTLSHIAIKLTSPSTTVTPIWQLDCDCYVTGFSISGRVDDKITGSITVELTGAINWATVA